MPIISLSGCHTQKNICELNITAKVRFSPEYYRSPKAWEKLKELQEDLEKVMEKYFDQDYQSDCWLSDHNYNLQKESDW